MFAALTGNNGAGGDAAGGKAAATGLTTVPRVARILANYHVNARYDDPPAEVRKEGTRTLLNWVGGAVGGSRENPVKCAIAASRPFSGPP
ncbi:hypothetical protein OVY01_19320 [Robbsia sp. Bb-Pol-6]|uniref:Uncharacterized protein n=1 Tax=Robbsia betulipollinis TaxID=2981849 RepID=A0ABT3ZRW6_9BURK|nr:hypothetical protein [Robbsia betulipollinis]MCY0389301.1 hypothetical protein [Robbsia betulipollinis]